MTRPEILALLEPGKIYFDHHALRLAIVTFVREQEPNSPFIQNYHVFYDQTLGMEYSNMSWNEFLSDQEQNRVYCTELFSSLQLLYFYLSTYWLLPKHLLLHTHTHVSVGLLKKLSFYRHVPC